MKTYSSILPGAVLLLAAVLVPAICAPMGFLFSVRRHLSLCRVGGGRCSLAGVSIAAGWSSPFWCWLLGTRHCSVTFPAGSGGGRRFNPVVFGAVAFLLPINLAAISLITERGFGTPRGLARLGTDLDPNWFWWAWIIRPEQAERASWLDRPIVRDRHVTGWTPLPQPALLAFVGAFILLAVRFLLHRSAIESGFVWATAAAFFGLHAGEGGDHIHGLSLYGRFHPGDCGH